MDPKRREMIEKFFKKASVVVMVDKSPAVEICYNKGEFTVDVKNPLLLMGLGFDLDLLKRDDKKSVIRKAIKDMGFKIKLKYKMFEIQL
jgi:hypothetical protein